MNIGDISLLLGNMDPNCRALAKRLHETPYVYGAYHIWDGFGLVYSTNKYCMDISLTNSDRQSSDVMHEWLLTPAGISVTTIETLFLVTYSFLAFYFDGKEKNDFQRHLVSSWPYVRDLLKGLKNSFKGSRSLLQMIKLLGGQNTNLVILPLSIVLGVVAVLNRFWYRYMANCRKDMMKINIALIEASFNECSLVHLTDDPQSMLEDDLKDLLKGKTAYALYDGRLFYIRNNQVVELNPLADLDKAEIIEHFDLDEENNNKLAYATIAAMQLIAAKTQHQHNQLLTPEEIEALRDLATQPELEKTLAILSQVLSGMIDSLYLYMGVLTLTAVAPPLFLMISIFCMVQSLVCVLGRCYEEYDFQKKLEITQAKANLALDFKLLESLLQTLKMVQDGASAAQIEQYHQQRQSLLVHHRELQSMLNLSIASVIILGAKNGLAAYGSYTSCLFAVSTLLLLLSTPFPPALLISCVSIGIGFIVAFIGHALVYNHLHQQKQKDPLLKVAELDAALLDSEQGVKGLERAVKKTVEKPSSLLYLQDWFEIIRSFFSGLGKGPKLIDMPLNQLQEPDGDGHYHDSPVMLWISLGASVIYALTMALRALARLFGRSPLETVNLNMEKPAPDPEPGLPNLQPVPIPGLEPVLPALPDVPNDPLPLPPAKKSRSSSTLRHSVSATALPTMSMFAPLEASSSTGDTPATELVL